jgi:hypothetical protein
MNNELYHHGILGMRWGVRRYQNADGSLTAAGQKRYDKVASSSHLQKKDTKSAVSILSEKSKTLDAASKSNLKKAIKTYKKATNYETDMMVKELSGDKQGYSKYSEKAGNAYKKAETYATLASQLKSDKRKTDKKISDISDGTLKAGKDFIVQRDYNWNLYVITKDSTLIENKRRGDSRHGQ